MLNEMMNNSMAPAAQVGAIQAQGLNLSSGGQDSRGAPVDTSFALLMSHSRMGTVSETTGVSMAVTATSMRVGEGDVPAEEVASETPTGEPLNEDVVDHDADGDGVISSEEAMDAIILGIGMGAATETGKNAQKATSETMTNARRIQSQIMNGGRYTL